MRTGILGGTFDPVHNAHLMIAGQALEQIGLDEVIFIPTSHTPLKEDAIITPVEHRVRMVELAISGNPAFRMSRIEIDRAGISYTVDTITELKQTLGIDSELYFITGLDKLIRGAVLCNNASFESGVGLGDPTEIALLVLGEKAEIIEFFFTANHGVFGLRLGQFLVRDLFFKIGQ